MPLLDENSRQDTNGIERPQVCAGKAYCTCMLSASMGSAYCRDFTAFIGLKQLAVIRESLADHRERRAGIEKGRQSTRGWIFKPDCSPRFNDIFGICDGDFNAWTRVILIEGIPWQFNPTHIRKLNTLVRLATPALQENYGLHRIAGVQPEELRHKC
jgi:hypothetical protein